jgi:RNA polymerase sigma factor (sigma-70 family)
MNNDVNEMIEDNMNLIRKMANKIYMKNSVYSIDDLIQTGIVNLLTSLQKYDPKRAKLSTFICHCVRNSMVKFIKKNHDSHKLNACNIENIPLKDLEETQGRFNNFFDGDVVYGSNLYYYEDEVIDEYLKDHDDTSKEVIKMKISGHTQEEIKRKLSISVNQIKKILNKLENELIGNI